MSSSDEWDFLEDDGTILVSCWCESEDKRIPLAVFKQGRTLPCGRNECILIGEKEL